MMREIVLVAAAVLGLQASAGAPVLVGGDSMGDYDMLTAFPAMDRGLVYNYRPLTDNPLGRLVRSALSGENRRYLLQGRDDGKAALIPSPTSKGQLL